MTDLKHMAQCLRQRYEQNRTAKIGRPYSLPEKFRKPAMWLKVAEACDALKADPAVYIDAAFAESSMPDGPFASALAGGAAAYWYRCFTERLARGDITANPAESCLGDLEWSSTIISEHLMDRLGRGEDQFEALHGILANPLLNFPAFVRVVLAYPSYPDIVSRYLPEALEYFRRYPTATAACARQFPLVIEILTLKS